MKNLTTHQNLSTSATFIIYLLQCDTELNTYLTNCIVSETPKTGHLHILHKLIMFNHLKNIIVTVSKLGRRKIFRIQN